MAKVKIMYYLETIAAIKIGLCFQINELIKLNGYQRASYYLTLAKGHSEVKIKTWFSWKLLSHLEPNFI